MVEIHRCSVILFRLIKTLFKFIKPTKNATRTATTKHYDWALLNNRDIRDKYVLELRNRFEALQENVPQMTNMRISSTHTSRQQRIVLQQNLELNIESHGKR